MDCCKYNQAKENGCSCFFHIDFFVLSIVLLLNIVVSLTCTTYRYSAFIEA
jgi:hypothetical protein